jgi:hypothetical protein
VIYHLFLTEQLLFGHCVDYVNYKGMLIYADVLMTVLFTKSTSVGGVNTTVQFVSLFGFVNKTRILISQNEQHEDSLEYCFSVP